jgi:hypothetical protein
VNTWPCLIGASKASWFILGNIECLFISRLFWSWPEPFEECFKFELEGIPMFSLMFSFFIFSNPLTSFSSSIEIC